MGLLECHIHHRYVDGDGRRNLVLNVHVGRRKHALQSEHEHVLLLNNGRRHHVFCFVHHNLSHHGACCEMFNPSVEEMPSFATVQDD